MTLYFALYGFAGLVFLNLLISSYFHNKAMYELDAAVDEIKQAIKKQNKG